MLGEREVMATVAVRDLDRAIEFYEGVLGLEAEGGQEMEVRVYRCGSSKLLVYPSSYAGTNQATAATWNVGADVARIVRELEGKGVTFERYDFPGGRREGAVHVIGEIRSAWFKDPDGNILALVND